MKLSICIATYNRQHYLRQLLLAINQQKKPIGCNLSVTVSDNDSAGTSEAMIAELRHQLDYPIHYSVEARKGISQNRNNSVRIVDADTDFVLFVDDDELPDPDWINQLLHVQQTTNADVVSGLSLPSFVSSPPKWIDKGRFFIRSIYATLQDGTPLLPGNVMTGNLLVRYQALRNLVGPFDEKFGFTGGEDTDLGRRLAANQCRMVWAKNSIVREWIPDDRATLRWILQRAYRTANTIALLNSRTSAKTRLHTLIMGTGRIVFCFILLLPAIILSVVVGLHLPIHLVRIGLRGVGYLSGLFGMAYEEYSAKRTSSTPQLLTNLTD